MIVVVLLRCVCRSAVFFGFFPVSPSLLPCVCASIGVPGFFLVRSLSFRRSRPTRICGPFVQSLASLCLSVLGLSFFFSSFCKYKLLTQKNNAMATIAAGTTTTTTAAASSSLNDPTNCDGAVPSGFILKLYQMVNGAPDDIISVSEERKGRKKDD